MKKTNKGIIAACVAAAVLAVAGCGQTTSNTPASETAAQAPTGAVIPNTVFSADDLVGKTIGTQLGTTGYIFAGDVENATVEAYNKAADAIQALKQGKIDAVIIDSEPAKVFVQKNDDLTILSDPFAEEEYSIAYKIGNDELGKKIDDAITALKADGTLDNIFSHWIGDDADHVPYTPDSSVVRNGKLVMATNAEFPPYESMEGGAIVGIDVDMMNAVCDRIGMELEIENMAFDSIIAAVNSGKADVGVAGMSVTPDRQKNVSFTQGYAVSTQVIVVRK
ncbi:MAG TPA: amino acid ABC transporter substrate-binding protein [Ruminococcaceae bacterium]|nr:amino acid ABC transporter substrate-binding protein [Oscillospiraceae bacterium]